jgi:hypothetical protein
MASQCDPINKKSVDNSLNEINYYRPNDRDSDLFVMIFLFATFVWLKQLLALTGTGTEGNHYLC